MAEGPSVYFHLEMGVQWRPRTSDSAGSRNHQLTYGYMSKSARQRAHEFPRQLPPSTTNYLATVPHPQCAQHQSRHRYEHQHIGDSYQSYDNPSLFGQYSHPPCPQTHVAQPQPQPPPQPAYAQPQQAQHVQQNRSSRSESRSSHGRGRSAPPPLSENSWDATPEPMAASALPKRKSTKPQIWKALPPTPGQFHLGHDDLSWSPQTHASQGVESYNQDSPLVSPEPAAGQGSQPAHRGVDDRDKVRTKEMQSLATAMMTVDNGFEDQWWYQGPRLVNIAGDLIPPAVLAENYHRSSDGAYPGARDVISSQAAGSPAGTMADVVSPVSDVSNSGSSFILRRSLTTRSEELHMYG